ncbi:MAG: molybdenum cofactor synthesis domain-containing protein [Hyphomicrobiales bacterium]
MEKKDFPASIISVNIADETGTPKKPVNEIVLNDRGVLKDAACCRGHYQLCLFPTEQLDHVNSLLNKSYQYGELSEHITTRGIDFTEISPFDIIRIGDTVFEVTRLSNQWHVNDKDLIETVGCYRMPKGGALVRVLKGGTIRPGMAIELERKVFKANVVTLSDKASRGEIEDMHGPKIQKLLEGFFAENQWKSDVKKKIMADDEDSLRFILRQSKEEELDLVITLGGTGIGPRDITPDVVKTVLDKEIPGIMEGLRKKFGQDDPNAMLSRGVAGIMGNTIVMTLPGSICILDEYMEEIFKFLKHLLFMQKGLDLH